VACCDAPSGVTTEQKTVLMNIRLIVALGLVFSARMEATEAATGEMPIVPIISTMRHWDNHWFIWLPQDETYEAVEVMSLDNGPQGQPLIWAFFTERSGSKRQVHYVNNAEFARAARWIFAPIRYSVTGIDGAPRGADVDFADQNGRPVRIHFSAVGSQPLSPAGLTNQIGHAGASLLLMFYRAQHTRATDWSVEIGGKEVSRPGPSYVAPFLPAYSRDITTAAFVFGTGTATFGSIDSTVRGDIVFSSDASLGRYVGEFSGGARKVLETTVDGRLNSYSDWDGMHALRVDFANSLPSPCGGAVPTESRFAISIDGHTDQLAGYVSDSGGQNSTLRWSFDKPDWAANQTLTTSVVADCERDIQRVTVSAVKARGEPH
jgi:hypothetical protein